YGQGRCPYYLEAAIIVAITDGARYTSCTNVQNELNLPMNTGSPGAEFTIEPFRWDQRLFSIVLRLSGTYTIDPPANGTNFVVPCDDSPINAMCEVTGGECLIGLCELALFHRNLLIYLFIDSFQYLTRIIELVESTLTFFIFLF